MKDLIVVGAGPAGVAAALYGRARGLEVTIFDPHGVGGLIAGASLVSHYPALLGGESGAEFASRMADQLKTSGVELVREEVKAIEQIEAGWRVSTAVETLSCKSLVLATGSTPRRPAIEGLPQKVAHFASAIDAKDRACLVVGGGDGAAKEALALLDRGAKSLSLVFPEESLPCIAEFATPLKASPLVTLYPASSLTSIAQDLTSAHLATADGEVTLRCAEGLEVVICAGQVPNDSLTSTLLGPGFVKADEGCQTSLPGLWVAGDLRDKKVRQVATAAADGAVAGIAAAAWAKK